MNDFYEATYNCLNVKNKPKSSLNLRYNNLHTIQSFNDK